MEEKKPLVSIIVRTKDRPKLLKRALQSISAQAYRPIEVVLVNDGGCDLDVEGIKGILGDMSLNYVRLKENTGRAHAGNVGVENTKGEYIGFLDDDDEFYPEHVSTIVAFLRQSEYKIAYTLSEVVKVSSDTDGNEIVEVKDSSLFLQDFSKEMLLIENYLPLNTLILKRDILFEVGGIDEELELYEDWDLLIRISEKYPFYFIRKTTSKYIHWSKDEQITAKKGLAKEPYLKVINKHIHKINPEVLYSAYLLSHERKEHYKEILEKQGRIIKDLQLDMQEKQSRTIKNLQLNIQEKDRTIKDLQLNMQGKDRSIEDLQLNMQKEKESLLESVENLNATLDAIYQTLGWKLLNRYRNLRGKILPLGTRRGKIYALCIKSFKVLINEGWKNFFRKSKRRLKKDYFFEGLIRDKGHYDIRLHGADNYFQRRPVDIILPVFNCGDLLKACIESVLENTDLTFNNLIIIDDNSTDVRVGEVLQWLTQDGKDITIISNDMNIGFVKTANKGMRMSDKHDVIILNSDTIVTRNWVDKLQRAAYLSPDVATVTPFSNNATICSIPNFLENNQIPANFDIQSFGEFIENISLRYYPEIPTAIGFCMYIKRTVIQEVGFFDEKNFGKGYGEENDFCMRAMKMGYKNILDDSTFIYHKGGESFSISEKIKLERKGVDIVDAIHPEYLPMVYKFINENPLKPIHDYINLRLNFVKTISYK